MGLSQREAHCTLLSTGPTGLMAELPTTGEFGCPSKPGNVALSEIRLVAQLYSRYGGGCTHSLLLLAIAAKYLHLPYWHDTAQCGPASAKFIAFDGEKHNVINGAEMDEQGARTRSLAGYLLHKLGVPEAPSRCRPVFQYGTKSGCVSAILLSLIS